MFDKNMLDQLTNVFEKLENNIVLNLKRSSHEKFDELKEMLTEVASTSDKIILNLLEDQTDLPKFSLEYNGKPNGISFLGIPGGHEFTSLILAILNSDLKGKLPDNTIIERIKRIKGPIKLRTFISLSCENCPEVVQALNLISILHPSFEHEMINGELVQDEIEKLKIQGVPSVMDGDELVAAGKMTLMNIIEKLEANYGVDDSIEVQTKDLGLYDVAVIGAGPAGASAAIYSARKGLKTIVIGEKIGGQVQDTKGIENLISVPYTEGPELSNKLLSHMNEYDIEILEHRRVESVENEGISALKLNTGEFLKTKSLIVATGAQWRQLNIPGEKEYIGRGVAYCPHCDGPYYKGKDIAVIGGGNSGVEAAIDLAGIVKSIVLIEYASELKADKVLVDKLKSLENVKILKNARTHEVIGNKEKVTSLKYEDRNTNKINEISLDGIFVQIGLKPNSEFIKNTVEVNQFGEIVVDQKCKTNVQGIYAAGDVTTVPYKQIIISMGEGAKAALSSFEDLMLK